MKSCWVRSFCIGVITVVVLWQTYQKEHALLGPVPAAATVRKHHEVKLDVAPQYQSPNVDQSTSSTEKQSTDRPTRQESTPAPISDSKPEPEPQLKLSFDYTRLERLSPMARMLEKHQENCSLPVVNFQLVESGFGSTLHIYGQALCNTLAQKTYRMQTLPYWSWSEGQGCPPDNSLSCFFVGAERLCHQPDSSSEILKADNDLPMEDTVPAPEYVSVESLCEDLTAPYGGRSEYRAASTEFLFTRVAKFVQDEAERQLQIVFENETAVPDNMITVHLRWGDKGGEMELRPIHEYIQAVETIVHNHSISEVNIFLASEDPAAVTAFLEAAFPHWKIFLSPYRDMQSGRSALAAIGSLLVSMEAKHYILTLGSNWSRLINELRKTVLDLRCNNCTTMIDLLYDEW
jgi:hypothetical protein